MSACRCLIDRPNRERLWTVIGHISLSRVGRWCVELLQRPGGAYRTLTNTRRETRRRDGGDGDGNAAVDEIGRATRFFFLLSKYAGERSARPAVQGVLLRGRLQEAVRLGKGADVLFFSSPARKECRVVRKE